MPPIVKDEILQIDGQWKKKTFTETASVDLTNRDLAQTRIAAVLNANNVTNAQIHQDLFDDLVSNGII